LSYHGTIEGEPTRLLTLNPAEALLSVLPELAEEVARQLGVVGRDDLAATVPALRLESCYWPPGGHVELLNMSPRARVDSGGGLIGFEGSICLGDDSIVLDICGAITGIELLARPDVSASLRAAFEARVEAAPELLTLIPGLGLESYRPRLRMRLRRLFVRRRHLRTPAGDAPPYDG
jgi:hypothetical protein